MGKYDIDYSEFFCDHVGHITLVKKTTSRTLFYLWCCRCGKKISPVKTADCQKPASELPELDESVAETWWGRLTERHKQWWNNYTAYLNSPEWKEKRARILARSGGMCELCGKRAWQVHHLVYTNVFNENDNELQALCGPCHAQQHPNWNGEEHWATA